VATCGAGAFVTLMAGLEDGSAGCNAVEGVAAAEGTVLPVSEDSWPFEIPEP
jgi:hypothetical protein